MAGQQTAQGAAPTSGEGAPQGDALDELDNALADDGGDGQHGAQEPEEWTAPTREEWEAQQAAHNAELEATQGKLKRARAQAQRLREGRNAATAPAAAEDTPEGQQAASDAGEVAVWQERAARASARSMLLERGADPEMVDLALGRLRVGDIEFNRDGDPELDEWLDEMEERYPKLFAKAAATEPGRRAMGGVDQGRASGAAAQAKTKKRYGEQVLENSLRAQRRR